MSGDPYLATRSFFDTLVAVGVGHVLVSPGSRSTPLAVTAHHTPGLEVHVHLDERSAGFWALGMAKALASPVAVICSSGTAAANYLPAVIEAHFSEVPLLVLTADRPPELRDRGAGQTIDQLGLYGSHVRWWADLPVAGEVAPKWFGSTAARAVRAAMGARPGPVHLNWPLREPLEPRPDSFDIPVPDQRPLAIPAADPVGGATALERLTQIGAIERGLVLAGPMHADHHSAVAAFCQRTGWPLLAEPLSQLRRPHPRTVVISHHDHLLRTPWADQHVPEVVLRVGQPMTCKPLRLWLERHQPEHVVLDAATSWTDASVTATEMLTASPSILGEVDVTTKSDLGPGVGSWAAEWAHADAAAATAIDDILDAEPLLEAGIARELGRSLAPDATLYVSNSMPVRDVDTFLEARDEPLRCFGNRGASGIDGVISSAAGVASTGADTTLYIGDLAVVHDLGGLLSAAHHGVDLTIVVANNGGGGIFSFLPIAGHGEAVAFDRLFHTPHPVDLAALSHSVGATHTTARTQTELTAALRQGARGVRVVEIPVDRDANLDQHRRIAAAIATATAG